MKLGISIDIAHESCPKKTHKDIFWFQKSSEDSDGDMMYVCKGCGDKLWITLEFKKEGEPLTIEEFR